jgi:SAM-dependent methyltransferase
MADDDALPGVHPAPNIQQAPEVYEIENRAADPEMRIEAAMRAVRDWHAGDVVDVGCGTGFHLPRFAATARRVIGVEPHEASRVAAERRRDSLGLSNVSVVHGSAEALPLADRSVDIVHARFAYFFGPGCEKGVAECRRALRDGGVMFVVDNDLRHGTFASWLARSHWAPSHSADEVEEFWRAQGFTLTRVPSRWEFTSRRDLEAVVRIEFPPALAEELLAEHSGTVVEYHYALYWRRF